MKTYLQVFRFAELSEEAKKRAIANNEELIYLYINDSIREHLNSHYKPTLEDLGFEEVSLFEDSYNKIYINFKSIDFRSKNIFSEKYTEVVEKLYELTIKINRYTFTFECDWYNQEEADNSKLDELEKEVKSLIEKYELEINEFIQEENDYYFSEEVLKECIFVDNYFTKEGKKL